MTSHEMENKIHVWNYQPGVVKPILYMVDLNSSWLISMGYSRNCTPTRNCLTSSWYCWIWHNDIPSPLCLEHPPVSAMTRPVKPLFGQCFNHSKMIVWLVVSTPLKNMSSSVGIVVPSIWKNIKCSKPPTSFKWVWVIGTTLLHLGGFNPSYTDNLYIYIHVRIYGSPCQVVIEHSLLWNHQPYWK